MNALDFFFEGLGPLQTKEILQQEDVPFSFLVRIIGREHVVSFLDDHTNIQHQILPVRQDSSLFRHHPQLQHQGPVGVFNLLRNISTNWRHPVVKTNEMKIQMNDSGESLTADVDICWICGCMNPAKNHADSHRVIFCRPCNRMVPKSSKGNHKCQSPSIFQCPSCAFTSSTQQSLSRHVESRHDSDKKPFKCDSLNCEERFITKKRLLDHKGKAHGLGYSCEECGRSFRSKTSRNRHVSVAHQQHLWCLWILFPYINLITFFHFSFNVLL